MDYTLLYLTKQKGLRLIRKATLSATATLNGWMGRAFGSSNQHLENVIS